MSERIKAGMPGFLDQLLTTCKLVPAEQMLRQSIEAERMMRETHERLLAEGYEWDGMDGYSKTVKP